MRLSLAVLAAVAGLSATPAFADECIDEIKAVMTAAMNSGPMHMESTITAPGAEMKMSGDIVPPKSMHMNVDTNGEVIEMVILEDKAWMNQGGVWTEMPPEVAAQMTASFDMSDTSALDAMTSPVCGTTETVEGVEYDAYTWALDVEGSGTVNKVLADTETGAPVRMETEMTATGGNTKVLVDYTYDESITITAPAM